MRDTAIVTAAGLRYEVSTSEDPTLYGNTEDIERELQRVAITLRQIAGAVEHLLRRRLGEFVHLIAPTEELLRTARRMFQRPFGE